MRIKFKLSKKKKYFLIGSMLTLFLIVLLRNSWIGDDAYITFRTIDNFLNGYGLRWNIAGRVQTYTHPLWLFLITAVEFFNQNIFYTAHFVSLFVSIAVILIFVFLISSSFSGTILGLTILMLSNAFIEYSSSGLENPLTHFLSALFLWLFLTRKNDSMNLLYISFIASLAMVNRMDTILLFFPCILYCTVSFFSIKKILLMLLGFLPFILWECFSMIYYGFPFPNTAYAKLGADIPAITLAIKGLHYFGNSINKDPITLTMIFVSIVTSFVFLKKKLMPLTAGIILYLIYIVKIGGCFMSGRFFSAPVFWAMVLFIYSTEKYLSRKYVLIAVLSIVILLGFSSSTNPLFKHKDYGLDKKSLPLEMDQYGIEDAQLCYFQSTGLICIKKGVTPPYKLIFTNRDLKQMGIALKNQAPTVTVRYAIGIIGYYAGPDAHIIDIYALADPLLARLPMRDSDDWRIGHLTRVIPTRYIRTLELGRNMLFDSNIWKFYNKLFLITRGRLFDKERMEAIIDVNFRSHPDLKNSLKVFKNPKKLEHIKIAD